jgi:hypothetical protein
VGKSADSALPDLLPFRKKFFRGCVRLSLSLFLQLLIDAPHVSEWIDDLTVTRSPEHVSDRHNDLCAARYGTFDYAIGIVSL